MWLGELGHTKVSVLPMGRMAFPSKAEPQWGLTGLSGSPGVILSFAWQL